MSKCFNFDTTLFIDEIRKRPAIWDTSTDFSKVMKKKAWDEINDVFGEGNMSQADKSILACKLQQRWKNLRTCFGREMRRQRNCGSVAGRKVEYMYYKNLLFLTNVMNISDRDMSEPEYVYFYENETGQSQTTDNQSLTERSPIRDDDNKTHSHNERVTNKNKRNAYESEEPFSDEDEDEDRLFLLSLYESLKRVPIKKRWE